LAKAFTEWHGSGITEGKRNLLGLIVVEPEDANNTNATSYYWLAEAKNTASLVATGTYIDKFKKINRK